MCHIYSNAKISRLTVSHRGCQCLRQSNLRHGSTATSEQLAAVVAAAPPAFVEVLVILQFPSSVQMLAKLDTTTSH